MMLTSSNDNSLSRLPEHRPDDERANLVTHAIGFLLSVVAATLLLISVINKQQSPPIIIASIIYCCSLVGLYGASMLSHMFHDLAWRRFFRTLDQICIYLLIAGSFTPVAIVYLMNQWWPVLLMVMWSLAIGGVLLVIRMRNLTPRAMFTFGFIGGLPVVSLNEIYQTAPIEVFIWIIAGGICFCIGTFFLAFDRRVKFFHSIWHVMVIGGSCCHHFAILIAVTT